jgi:hypothetical protein
MDGMWGKIIRRGAAGFLIGILVGNLIVIVHHMISGGQLQWAAETLVQKAGSEAAAVFLQNLVSGLFGAFSMVGTIFYDLESWELTKASVVHCLLILAAYFPTALFCGWLEPNPGAILMMAVIMTGCYLLIWLVMYLRCRKEAEELNREIDVRRRT